MLKLFLLIIGVVVQALCLPNTHWVPRIVATTDEIDNDSASNTNNFNNTSLVLSFVVFRHGDRTPDPDELDQYPSRHFNTSIFFPYGRSALTNRGKQRAFKIGEYLRGRYNDAISELYLPDEISVRATDYARTKMTVLTVLAAMYPPPLLEKWNPDLNWQPIPYDAMPAEEDNFLYWSNCPRYEQLLQKVYEVPEVSRSIGSYKDLFQFLSEKTGAEITTPEDVFSLDNLFQALNNVDVPLPHWAEDSIPKIKEMTKIEYSCMFYDNELIKLAAGVFMTEVLNAMNAAITENKNQPILRLYSAHEDNVAALLAATRTFKPHQPKYGATASLELRKNLNTGKYVVMVVYAAEAGGPGVILPINGCGEKPLCDYDNFVTLTNDILLERSDYKKECSPLS